VAGRVDADETRHTGKVAAIEQNEGAVGGVADVAVDAGVKPVGTEIVGVDLPDFRILLACGLERVAVPLRESLGGTAVAGHRLRQPFEVDHS